MPRVVYVYLDGVWAVRTIPDALTRVGDWECVRVEFPAAPVAPRAVVCSVLGSQSIVVLDTAACAPNLPAVAASGAHVYLATACSAALAQAWPTWTNAEWDAVLLMNTSTKESALWHVLLEAACTMVETLFEPAGVRFNDSGLEPRAAQTVRRRRHGCSIDWVALHAAIRRGEIELVETRVVWANGEFILPRARGARVDSIRTSALARIRLHTDFVTWHAVRACGEILVKTSRTLEEYGVDDETPIEIV